LRAHGAHGIFSSTQGLASGRVIGSLLSFVERRPGRMHRAARLWQDSDVGSGYDNVELLKLRIENRLRIHPNGNNEKRKRVNSRETEEGI